VVLSISLPQFRFLGFIMTKKVASQTANPASVLGPWPYYGDDEIEAVTDVLRSGRANYWTGPEGSNFETEYAAHCGTTHGLAVANGTVAIELALWGIGIKPGDEVVVPTRTFIATASAVVRMGAVPVVADVNTISQNISAETVDAVITNRTRAIIVVHLSGWPVDMNPIMALAKKKDLSVIEDCAQAHGAQYRERPVAGIGHVGCFSFCQDKIISTGGEGGMVVTSDIQIYKRMWAFRDHGKSYERVHKDELTQGFQWLIDSFGTNWRLTEMQATIGRMQLRKLSDWVKKRRKNATVLTEWLSGLPAVHVPKPEPHSYHSYYKYNFIINPDTLKAGWSRDRILEELVKLGVPARVGSCFNVSQELAFDNSNFPVGDLPNARSLEYKTLTLPCHPTLTKENLTFLGESLRKVITEATL